MLFNISFVHYLVILSILISTAGSFQYIKDTLSGKSRPNKVSWFMWAFAALVSAGASISAHADLWTTSRVFIAGFIPLLIFIFSFANKKSYWKITSFDFLCGFFSLIALIAWVFARSLEIAVLFAVLGDAIAAVPTIIKAWKYPETETGFLYVASIISVLLVLPAIPEWNIVNSAFQIYLLIATSALTFAVYRKKLIK